MLTLNDDGQLVYYVPYGLGEVPFTNGKSAAEMLYDPAFHEQYSRLVPAMRAVAMKDPDYLADWQLLEQTNDLLHRADYPETADWHLIWRLMPAAAPIKLRRAIAARTNDRVAALELEIIELKERIDQLESRRGD